MLKDITLNEMEVLADVYVRNEDMYSIWSKTDGRKHLREWINENGIEKMYTDEFLIHMIKKFMEECNIEGA